VGVLRSLFQLPSSWLFVLGFYASGARSIAADVELGTNNHESLPAVLRAAGRGGRGAQPVWRRTVVGV